MPTIRTRGLSLLCALMAVGAGAPAVAAPIPQARPGAFPAFEGAPAVPDPIAAPAPPRHPFMAPNGRSNIHDDAYQTDTYPGLGPLGRGGLATTSTSYTADCASVTFDARGRIVTACVALAGVELKLLDPTTLAELGSFTLPARQPGLGNPFQNFTGGGYFYLDDRDRAVVPTADRHLDTIAVTAGGFRKTADADLSSVVAADDGIISALPDWSGRIWVASKNGVVATVDRRSGAVRSVDTREGIGNSFAIDETGGVFIVTNAAMYRFDAGPDGTPVVTWREPYANIGQTKSGQSQAGSGTTPTLLGRDLVAITDNADPMNVVVLRRGRTVTGSRLTCRQSVFGRGAGSTDQSLVGTPGFVIVENNFGYTGPQATELGRTTTPGLSRVDLDPRGRGCRVRWTSAEIAPTVVPKLSLGAGLLYTYTKRARGDLGDPWYLTTIDARTGDTVYRALAGEGLGFNNNYAPVTIGPDGAAYVGTLGGLVRLADRLALPPAAARRPPRRPRLTVRCLPPAGRRWVLAQVRGPHVRRVRFAVAGGGSVLDARRPFARRYPLRLAGRRLSARVVRASGPALTLRRRIPRCA